MSPSGLRIGELDRVALKGRGPLRHFLPFTASPNSRRGEVLSVPLGFLRRAKASAEVQVTGQV